MSKIKSLSLPTFLSLLLVIILGSCKDEPKVQSEIMYEDTGLSDSYVIRHNSSNLLSVLIDYPEIQVESLYSNITAQPIIEYVGQFDRIEDIPLTTERRGAPTATLKDQGGYLINLERYDAATKDNETILVRMLVRLKYDEAGEPYGVGMQYQIAY